MTSRLTSKAWFIYIYRAPGYSSPKWICGANLGKHSNFGLQDCSGGNFANFIKREVSGRIKYSTILAMIILLSKMIKLHTTTLQKPKIPMFLGVLWGSFFLTGKNENGTNPFLLKHQGTTVGC